MDGGSPRTGRSRSESFVTAVGWVGSFGLLALLLLVVAPRFEALFRDAGAAVPGWLSPAFAASHFVGSPLGKTCLAAAILAGLVALVVAGRRPAIRRAFLALGALVLVLTLLVIAALMAAQPLLQEAVRAAGG